jgi:hypothetical protein
MYNLFSTMVERFTYTLGLAVRFASGLEPERTGGYACVASPANGLPIYIQLIGDISEEKVAGCFAIVQEKTKRLSEHRDHESSWESRDVSPDDKAKRKYGGAIRAGDFLLGFSGFSEQMDEAIMLFVARRLDLMHEDRAAEIAKRNGNEKYRELEDKIRGH